MAARIRKNKILTSDGKPFPRTRRKPPRHPLLRRVHLREGASQEVMHQADELVDRWHSNFFACSSRAIRLDELIVLDSSPATAFTYLKDIVAIVEHIGKESPTVYLEVSL